MVTLLTQTETDSTNRTLTPETRGEDIDPFGRVFSSEGPFKDTNKWRFSTKPAEDAWGLYYYIYRYYQPDTGRWINRDQLAEVVQSLYAFVSLVS